MYDLEDDLNLNFKALIDEYKNQINPYDYVNIRDIEETDEETDEEKLDNIDIRVIESYVRKKKLEIINKK